MKKSIGISLVVISWTVACAWVRAEDAGAGKASPGANWNVALTTEAAELHGGQMKEEKGGRSNIGGWDNAADWVSWKVKFPEIGSFKASAQIATMDGSEIVLEVGGQQISAKAPRTGGWGNPELLKDMENVTLLDIGPNFLDDKGFLLKGVMPDTTHPSELGYEIWAKATEPELKKLLGE